MSGGKKSQTKITNCMKEELLKWLCIKHALNLPMTREMLRQKAQELLKRYDLTSFKCSESWITVFLKRYQIPTNLSDGMGPVFDDYQTWVGLIRDILSQYSYENQFHLEEITLYTDFLPSPRLQSHEVSEAPVDMSTLKLQLTTPAMHQTTLLLACNSTGSQKLKPLICGPYPVQEAPGFSYIQSHDSRISDEILSAWLFVFNRQMAESDRRVILVLPRKRVNVLKLVRLTHVLAVFLPRSYPPDLRPLRGDISLFLKMHYRRAYVEKLCETEGPLWTPQQISETLVEAWEELPRESIVFRFQSTKFREDQSSLSLECPTWETLKTGVAFERFVTFDDNLGETPEPLRDDLRFLTNVKRQFNVKILNAEKKVKDSDHPQDSEAQSKISEAFANEEGSERPSDDFVEDSEDDEPEPVKGPRSPGEAPIKTETTVSSGKSSIEEIGSPVLENTRNVPEIPKLWVNSFGASTFSQNEFNEPSAAIKKLFADQMREKFEVQTPDSVDSTTFDELESTIEESLPLADSKDETADSFGDSGVPEEPENLEKNLEEVSDDNEMENRAPEEISTENFKDISTVVRKDEVETPVLTTLVNVRMDATSPGAVLAAQFIGNSCQQSEDIADMLNTSSEGAMITVKHFVDERAYFMFNEEVAEDDVEGTPNVDNQEDEPMDTSQDTNPGELCENTDSLKNSDLSEEVDQIDEHSPNFGQDRKTSSEWQKNLTENCSEVMEKRNTVDEGEISEIICQRSSSADNIKGSNISLRTSEIFNADDSSKVIATSSEDMPENREDHDDQKYREDQEHQGCHEDQRDRRSGENQACDEKYQNLAIFGADNCHEQPSADLEEVFPMKILNSSPVTPFSSESALQEASRELEEKLRDLEAHDVSRKIGSDDESSASELSSSSASVLRDLLNASKDSGESAGFSGISSEFKGTNQIKGVKRPREGDEEECNERKKMTRDN